MADADKLAEAQAALPLDGGAPPPAAPAAAAPAVESAPAATPAPSPTAASAPSPEPVQTADAAKTELTGDKKSLLEKFDEEATPKLSEAAKAEAKSAEPAKDAPKSDAKPAETDKKPAETAKAEEKPKTDAKAEAPKAEAKPDEAAKAAADAARAAEIQTIANSLKFELPEQLKSTKADDPIFAGFRTAIAEATKDPVAGGQKLLNLHAEAMETFAKQIEERQHKGFNDYRDDLAKQVLSDEQIGGAGHQTAMRAIARMRDLLVSSAKPGTAEYQADQKALTQFMRLTGAGDHPIFLKMLHNAARFFDEPGLPPENPRPPTDNGRAPGDRRRTIYDHPRSNVNRQ